MSSPTAGVADVGRGGPQVGRGRASRPRRLLFTAVVAMLAVGLAVVLIPLARKAIDDLTLPLSHTTIIRQQAAAKRLDPALVAAVIYAESRFDPRTSPAGAQGLMQLMPQTAELLARRSGGISFHVADLAKPNVNIAYGTYLLRYLIDHYDGNVALALAAYNAGISNVDRWVAQWRKRGRSLTLRRIPFPETRLYVERVLDAQREYRHVYGKQLGY